MHWCHRVWGDHWERVYLSLWWNVERGLYGVMQNECLLEDWSKWWEIMCTRRRWVSVLTPLSRLLGDWKNILSGRGRSVFKAQERDRLISSPFVLSLFWMVAVDIGGPYHHLHKMSTRDTSGATRRGGGFTYTPVFTSPSRVVRVPQQAPVQQAMVVPPTAYPQQAMVQLPRGQINCAHDNLRKVLDDNAALETRLDRLQRECSELKAQNDSLNSQVVALTQENCELRDELSIYERARNHPLVGEAVRSLTRNVNQPPPVEPVTRSTTPWCWH